jgi:hypothetical protein
MRDQSSSCEIIAPASGCSHYGVIYLGGFAVLGVPDDCRFRTVTGDLLSGTFLEDLEQD